MPAPTSLSPLFSLDELTRSQTAVRRGIANVPSAHEVENLRRLVKLILDPIERSLGVVQVTSGYRSPKLNAAMGGSPRSQHMHGLAADIVLKGVTPTQLCHWICDQHLPFDQLIHEGTWVHVSVAAEGWPPRGQKHTARFVDGRAIYSTGLPAEGRA